MKEIVSTEKAPAAVGPYSQAIITDDRIIFTSGQIPLDPKTGNVVGSDIVTQSAQALKNLEAVLEEAGFQMKDVVKTTVFITDMAQFAVVNEVYANFFVAGAPARSCVEVSKLPKGCLVEIEAIAVKE